MKKLYFLGLISLLANSLAGQIILHRQIVDEKNRPIAGVNVWRKPANEFTVTDENGRFYFTFFHGTDTFEILHFGFEPAYIQTRTETTGNDIKIHLPLYDKELPDAIIPMELMPAGIPEEIMTPKNYYTVFFPIPVVLTKIQPLKSISFPDFCAPSIRAFPVPTANTLYLQQKTALGQIDLYNLSGQKLQSFNFSDQLNASIDLSAWPAGTYLLRSSAGWVEKVILQKQ